jgi:hypothetical protein
MSRRSDAQAEALGEGGSMLLPDLFICNELQPPFGATDGIGDADSLGNNR